MRATQGGESDADGDETPNVWPAVGASATAHLKSGVTASELRAFLSSHFRYKKRDRVFQR